MDHHSGMLTPAEKKIFGAIQTIFSALAKEIDPRAAQTVIRVAGGWVRDKMLGKECNDIDIAIDNIPIDDFVNGIRKLQHPLVENVAQNENRELRTVMITICGEQVEFVNLRTVGFGIPDVPPSLPPGCLDPWIDAHLRDLTINSLFYNVNHNKVEDWTGIGVSDIRQKLLRTPIKPEDSWRADPHRMLRLIRFATKLGYTISDETDAALMRPEVVSMIGDVSRERFLTEIEKICGSDSVAQGFRLLFKYSLQKYIVDSDQPSRDIWTEARCLKSLQCIEEGVRLFAFDKILDGTERAVLVWTLILAPFCFYDDARSEYGISNIPFTRYRMRDVWKLPSKTIESIFAYLGGAETFMKNSAIFNFDKAELKSQTGLIEVGFMIRSLQSKWTHAFKLFELFSQIFSPPCTRFAPDFFQRAESLLDNIGLTNVDKTPIWLWKPLLSSEELIKLLSVKGPQVGQAIKECLSWQIIHSSDDSVDLEACKSHLLQWKANL